MSTDPETFTSDEDPDAEAQDADPVSDSNPAPDVVENADPQSVPNPIPPTDPDLTQAEAINNGFIGAQQRLLYTDPNAFYGKTGEDALLAMPGILDQLQDLHRHTLSLAPTRASAGACRARSTTTSP